MKAMYVFLILLFSTIFFGCNNPIEAPETIDPIYTDLLNQSSSYDRQAKEVLKELEAAQKEIDQAKPQSGQLDAARKKYFEFEKLVEKNKQLAKYYQLRAESRKNEDKKNYMIAFEKGETWPKKEELIQYKQLKQLNQASKKWDDRVPKPNFVKKETIGAGSAKSEEKKSAAGSGGEAPAGGH